jgi:hypothetical protein
MIPVLSLLWIGLLASCFTLLPDIRYHVVACVILPLLLVLCLSRLERKAT